MAKSKRREAWDIFQRIGDWTPDARKAYLDRECWDPDLRAGVESLLTMYDRIETAELGAIGESASRGAGSIPEFSTGSANHGRFLPGTQLGTRFRIVALLGKGGMGEVYWADDLHLGQSVALKFLPERLAASPAALKRLRTEVRLARQVSHPNVCRVYDISEADGLYFLQMEYVDGEDLSSLLRRIGRFPKERAVRIARELCRFRPGERPLLPLRAPDADLTRKPSTPSGDLHPGSLPAYSGSGRPKYPLSFER